MWSPRAWSARAFGVPVLSTPLAESLYRTGYRDGVLDRSPSKDHDDYMTGWQEGQSQHQRDADAALV